MEKILVNGNNCQEIVAVSYYGKKNMYYKYWVKGVDGIERRITKEDARDLQRNNGINVKIMVGWDRDSDTNIYENIVID